MYNMRGYISLASFFVVAVAHAAKFESLSVTGFVLSDEVKYMAVGLVAIFVIAVAYIGYRLAGRKHEKLQRLVMTKKRVHKSSKKTRKKR